MKFTAEVGGGVSVKFTAEVALMQRSESVGSPSGEQRRMSPSRYPSSFECSLERKQAHL